jgi:hypothetical protein
MRYLKTASYEGEYKIKIKFDSGEEFVVDLKSSLDGEIFAALKDLERFSEFSVDPDLETLTWKNGADFAPEYLYELGKKQLKQLA